MLKKSQNNCKIISSWQTQDIIISDLSLIIRVDLLIIRVDLLIIRVNLCRPFFLEC